jgi:hypothetical protein|tara:strand:+ start:1096 stop:1575 length:480 start_codon:yes stop_codon:yes gene_type:complete
LQVIFGANSLSGPFVILALQYDISCGIVSPCDKSAGTIDNQTTYKIYGMPASLYSGKVRSYLLKQHIPFIDFGACDSLFQRHIIPAVGRMIMPVVETPNGILSQDNADIIDFFERNTRSRLPGVPESSLSASIAYLFELFGGEGLVRPKMLYRCSFDEQ